MHIISHDLRCHSKAFYKDIYTVRTIGRCIDGMRTFISEVEKLETPSAEVIATIKTTLMKIF